ncbi:MAG: hypothetical protein ABIE36_02455 [Candidatus Diapherotrites archaeon]
MEKIDVQFDKNLDYIIELKGELVQARELMKSDNKLNQCTGANAVLCSYLPKYENLSENAKRHLDEDTNELEKLAVNVLVNQGHSKFVKVDLLKKYGLFCGEKGK